MAATSVVVRDYRTLPGRLADNAYYFPSIQSDSRSSKRGMRWQIYVRCFDARENADYEKNLDDIKFSEFLPTYLDNKPISAHIYGWFKVDSGVIDGKVRKSAPTIVRVGKNAGRANATNAVCQAMRDAYSQYMVQLRRSSAPEDTGDMFPPMLAQIYTPGSIPFPAMVQRKYDGIRTVAMYQDGKVVLYSRNKKIYPGLDYIKKDLKALFEYIADEGRRIYVDGELYKHGVSLQKISGNGRRETTVVTDYKYMVYDCFFPDEPGMKAVDRNETIKALLTGTGTNYSEYVETFTADTEDDVRRLYDQFISEGYEGAMIRDSNANYVYSKRGFHCSVLRKIKPELDGEFEVVDWTTGENGKAAGLLLIICRAGDKLFTVTPALPEPRRKELAGLMAGVEDNGKTHFENVWKGKFIVVKYASLSEDKVPLQPRTGLEGRVDEPAADNNETA